MRPLAGRAGSVQRSSQPQPAIPSSFAQPSRRRYPFEKHRYLGGLHLSPDQFDVRRFEDWLTAVTGEPATVAVTPIRGGGSCEMFRVDRLGLSWVLRRAPLVAVSDTAHQVVREAKIIAALADCDVPVPTILAIGYDPQIIGAPFFVMSCVDGEVARRDGLPNYLAQVPETHHRIGEELVDTLARLHAIEWRRTVLAELSRPEGFLERQVNRWMAQLESYRFRPLDGVDDVATWLTDNLPPTGELAVMHGDYKLDNVMWGRYQPPTIVSILDFEMTTVGDPLIDLAWALNFWPEAGNLIALAAPANPSGITADRCQSPEELARRYAEHTGRDLSHFQWYQAFSAWKLAIVLEGSYAAYVRGASTNPHHQNFGFVADELLAHARRYAR
jgi:aminoglycoside phosphotransferase (APT) family kinase protein